MGLGNACVLFVVSFSLLYSLWLTWLVLVAWIGCFGLHDSVVYSFVLYCCDFRLLYLGVCDLFVSVLLWIWLYLFWVVVVFDSTLRYGSFDLWHWWLVVMRGWFCGVLVFGLNVFWCLLSGLWVCLIGLFAEFRPVVCFWWLCFGLFVWFVLAFVCLISVLLDTIGLFWC